MKVIIAKNSKELAEFASDMIQQCIIQKRNCVLGLATGSTPVDTYKELIQRYKEKRIDFSEVKTFNLDEYYGLVADHPQSYHTFMHQHLFNHINIKTSNIHIPSGVPKNVSEYCEHYEALIKQSGGIDLQLLGIGKNGHIGFNEPSEHLHANTHLVQLKEDTITANARFFKRKEEVPKYAITMGIGTILSAKKLLLIATGKEKAEIIRKLFQAGVTTDIPASLLKLHSDVTIIVDEDAGSLVMDQINNRLVNSLD